VRSDFDAIPAEDAAEDAAADAGGAPTPAPVELSAHRRPRRRARRGEGDALRGEILLAARELLERTGSEEAVSIRSVAAEVGVSTPAIYLHFADKAALIDAVCVEVFAELDASMVEASKGAGHPMDELRLFGLEYVRFARTHPEQYRIVMMTRRPDHRDHEQFPAFRHLVELVAKCQAAGVFDATVSPEEIGLTLWAAAHGAASLMVSKPLLIEAAGAEGLGDRLITAIGAGLAVLLPGGADVSQLLGSEHLR
jgi:AcrR family transcriptional regulator